MAHDWSVAAQECRRVELAAVIRRAFRPLVDAQARSGLLVWWDQDRVALWTANAFLLGAAADIAFANTILRYVRDDLRPQPGPNVFGAAALASLLARHEPRLAPDVREFALRTLDFTLPHGTTRDFQFHGFNDNMPVMWSWALTAGGERLGNPRFTEVAWANLCQLRDLLRRRGTVSEYGAGYATHRLTGLAEIAAHSRDPAFRSLARDLEARLWAEQAGHWHPGLHQLCGASMRGGPPLQTETSFLYRHVFGEAALLPGLTLDGWLARASADFIRETGVPTPGSLFAYPYAYAAEFTGADYHVPDAVAALLLGKTLPATFRCTAEVGYHNPGVYCKQLPVLGIGGVQITSRLTSDEVEVPHHPAHGAQPHDLVTHHGRHFSLGTATTNPFATSHAFRCTYRRRPQVRGPADLGNVFVRGNLNDKTPGGRHRNHYWKSPELPFEQENYCTLYLDQARHHCLQAGGTALCLQVPMAAETWQVRSLRTDLFCHRRHGEIGPVWVGDRRVTAFPFLADAAAPVTIDEGAVHLGVVPLISRHGPRAAAMKLWQTEEYLVLSLYSLEAPPAEMTARQLAKLGNGFVFEARDAGGPGSFAAFQAELAAARTQDLLYGGVRRVHYARPGLWLSLHLCPYTQTVKHRAVNGRTPESPQFACDGLVAGTLPFLDEAPADGLAEWDWIRVQAEREAEGYNPVD